MKNWFQPSIIVKTLQIVMMAHISFSRNFDKDQHRRKIGKLTCQIKKKIIIIIEKS